jgi:predicted metal-dependent hydrolase
MRRMKARWGSCGTNGVITLNLKLMQAELASIDYVIVHELCHLIEHNHSKRYYALLGKMMPDWRARRQRLNEAERG